VNRTLLKIIFLILILIIFVVSLYLKPPGRRPSARGTPKDQAARVPQKLEGQVIEVKDGDTIKIRREDGQTLTCRLYGIDAPEVPHRRENGQPYGEEALEELSRLVYGKVVQVETTGERTYNREVCHVFLTNGKKQDVSLEMVKRGYAWAYRQYLGRAYASEYIEAEEKAREAEKGLWKQKNPQPPWEFRKLNSRRV
jgi:micrococcal nuclease